MTNYIYAQDAYVEGTATLYLLGFFGKYYWVILSVLGVIYLFYLTSFLKKFFRKDDKNV